MLAFSWLRNSINLNQQPRSLKDALAEERDRKDLKESQKISKYLKVFNGLKGSAIILMGWAFTFYFVQFTVINNPDQFNEMKQKPAFSIVTACIFIVPMYFFCSGFL